MNDEPLKRYSPEQPEQPEALSSTSDNGSSDDWDDWDGWDDGGYTPETIDAEELIQRRASPRKRAVQIGTALALAAVVALVLHSAMPRINRSAAAPASAAFGGPRMVAILSNVTFGSVIINGKRLTGHMPFVFTPSSSADTVTFDAPPFEPQTCRVSWEHDQVVSWEITQNISTSGTCASGWGDSGLVVSQHGRTMQVNDFLAFVFGPDDLPPSMKAAAEALIQQSIAPVVRSITVPAGQYYATGRDARGTILSSRTDTPLTAQLSLGLPGPHDFSPTSFCQEVFCAGAPFGSPGEMTGPTGDDWNVQVPLVLRWQFLDASGQVVGTETDDQIPATLSPTLRLTSDGHWQLAALPPPLASIQETMRDEIAASVCETGANELQNMFQTIQTSDQNVMPAADKGLAGCELQTIADDGGVRAHVIWRFGVLLAADPGTHQEYPQLPLAPPAEISAITGA